MNILLTGKNGVLGNKLFNLFENQYNVFWIKHNDIQKVFFKSGNFNISELKNKQMDFFIHCATLKNGKDSNVFYSNIIYPIKILEYLDDNIKIINIDTTSYFYRKNNYGLSKQIFKYYLTYKNLNYKNLYIEHIISSRSFLKDIIIKMLKNEPVYFSEGSQVRNFVSLDDLVNMINIVVKNFEDIKENELGLFSNDNLSIRDIVLKIHQIIGSKSELNFGVIKIDENEYKQLTFNNKIFKNLGWEQRKTIEYSLKELIEEIKNEI